MSSEKSKRLKIMALRDEALILTQKRNGLTRQYIDTRNAIDAEIASKRRQANALAMRDAESD